MVFFALLTAFIAVFFDFFWLFLHFFALFIAFIAFLVNLWMNLKHHVSSLSIDLKNRFLEIYGWT